MVMAEAARALPIDTGFENPGVPEGYKQSELGLIPEDWKVEPLSELCMQITDGEHLTPQRTSHGYYLLSARNVLNGSVDLSDVDFVGEAEYRRIRQRCAPEPGDVLISCSGTVGRIATVPAQLECVLVRSAALLKPNRRKAEGLFIQYFLQSQEGQRQIYASLNQGAQPNLFLNAIEKLKIATPSTTAEQRNIAEALSEADAFIESVETIIAKHRRIKQGTLRRLLTPEAEWKRERLGGLAKLINGRAYSLTEWETVGVPVIRLQNLTGSGDAYYYSTLSLPERQYCQDGDLLFMWSATFGPVIWRGPRAIFHYHIWKIECDALKLSKHFLYHLLVDITDKVKANSTSGGTMLHLTKAGMEAMEISLPDPAAQIRIAEVLSDMDAEIEALEDKLVKARQIRQGMMLELLTGKVRLV